MKLLAGLGSRVRSLFRTRFDRELQDELTSHLELHIEDNLRSGMSPKEARRQAMIVGGARFLWFVPGRPV